MSIDLPDTLVLAVGQEQDLRLPGRGTVGYVWNYRLDGPPDVLVVNITGAPAVPDASGPSPTGSVTELVHIRAVKAGEVRLHLELLRPWQSDRPPLASSDIDVRVIL